jgi:DNA-binding NarL/FixJ family response regulator
LQNVIGVSIVDDEKVTREGLAQLVAGSPGFRVLGAFASMEEALPLLTEAPPDVLLTDIGLPGMDGIEGVRRLRVHHPDLPILILTVFGDDARIFEAICAGACGYLLKDTTPSRLLEAIQELAKGGAPMSPEIARRVVATFQRFAPPREQEHRLTERELELLALLVDGHSYKTAARALSLSIDTVRFHVRNVYTKLHVHSKSEAVITALRRGILR